MDEKLEVKIAQAESARTTIRGLTKEIGQLADELQRLTDMSLSEFAISEGRKK